MFVNRAPSTFQEDSVGVPYVEANGLFACVFRYHPDTNKKQKITYNYGDGVKIYSVETYFSDGIRVREQVVMPGFCSGKPLSYVKFNENGDVIRKITRDQNGKPIHQFKSMYLKDKDELCQLEYSGIELTNIANFNNGSMYRQVEFEKEKRKIDDADLPRYDKSDPDFVQIATKNDNCHYCRAKRIVTYDPETNLSTTVYAGDDFIPPSKYVTNEKDTIMLHEIYHRSNSELAERIIYDSEGNIDEKYVYDENGELVAHNKYTHRRNEKKEETHHNIFVHKAHKSLGDKIREMFKK